jgi:hypothetical protein
MTSKVACYTAVFGGYDSLKPHVEIEGVDWIVFSDDAQLKDRDDWQVETPERADSLYGKALLAAHPRLAAKVYKIVGSSLLDTLDDYDFSLWVDASHEVTSPAFVDEALADLGPDGFSLFSHPHRDCIYDEAIASLCVAKYAGQPIRQQVEHYRAEGYPAHNGLWACGTLARARSAKLDKAMLDWWSEIEKWSIQDQLSLPVVLDRHGIEPQPFPHNQISWRWFTMHKHSDGTS